MIEGSLDHITVERIGGIASGIVFAYLVVELLALHFRYRRLNLRVARMALLGLVSNAIAGIMLALLLGPLTTGIAALAAAPHALFETSREWYGWIYGFLVYEFFYWLQHWLAHKVRILWCIHSPHHAPKGIHMAIGTNHHFVEGLLYFPLFLGFLPVLFGVDPLIAISISVLDVFWGSFLHIAETTVPKGRYGFIGRFMQTPSHHRVHHARNPGYLDRNYNSITLFWDWALGTLEPLDDEEPIEFGISRDVDDGSFWDVHFGEFVALYRDVRNASSMSAAIGTLVRPPGWQPGDASRTASVIRQTWIRDHSVIGEADTAGP